MSYPLHCESCGRDLPNNVDAVPSHSSEAEATPVVYCPACGARIDHDEPTAEEILGKHAVDQDPPDMELLGQCIDNSSAARGIDMYAVEERGYSAAKWAEMTGRDRSTVSRNVRRANGN